ncbi:1,2-phenylacetyl-CoA epoxidase subunit PaaE [Ferruginibacter yonginensis]|uniref:1,2-phenylacetyl-CoA epoxidase subunit PaaE n=1 Tax=Ferruginibacter yonginensis TaxID=1310416 RepID=A0ABV8QSJ6_9BACT
MASHFHAIKVKEVIRETPECVSISFDIPEHLQTVFQYKEGQNITIKTTINQQDVRRSYSICNAPYENQLKVAIKKTTGGLFSTYANEHIKAGDVLEIMPPTGRFTAKNTTGNFLAIAAGSGITPIMSIIKHTLKTQPNSHFTLIYGNKSRGSIIFFEEIESLKNKYMNRFVCVNVLSKERTDADINYGRIDAEKLNALTPLIQFEKMNDVYICGPEAMIFSAADFLEHKGISKNNIHFELFTTPGQAKQQSSETLAQKQVGPTSNITVRLDGRTFEFDLPQNSQNILDAALAQGADLPYACKGGVCCTCRAKLLEGQVKMDVNYALEADEVAQGFILTCQSHPLTEKVIIDFDIK